MREILHQGTAMEFFLQIALNLVCLFYGARKGGVALGLLGGAAACADGLTDA